MFAEGVVKITRTILLLVLLGFFSWSNEAIALCVMVSKANLRIGPGVNYEIGWRVSKYMPFKKVGISILSDDWYAVEDVDNDVLWIHKSLITSKYHCAVVNAEEVNLRTGPGIHYDKHLSSPVEQHFCARILKKNGPWIKIINESGETGWIHEDYLWIQ